MDQLAANSVTSRIVRTRIMTFLYRRHRHWQAIPLYVVSQLPAFANVSLGDAQILLSGPGASGSRPMPNGSSRSRAGGIEWC